MYMHTCVYTNTQRRVGQARGGGREKGVLRDGAIITSIIIIIITASITSITIIHYSYHY